MLRYWRNAVQNLTVIDLCLVRPVDAGLKFVC